MSTTSQTTIRELDSRSTDGIEVRLLWNSQTNQVSVAVFDGRSGEVFELPVAAADALDAFRHPYAWASRGRPERAMAA